MLISVRGNPKNASRGIVKKAVQFYADLLMSKRLQKNITIEITFVANFKTSKLGRRFGLDVTDWGIVDYDIDTIGAPREFEIEIHNAIGSDQKLLEVLAHELVHIKQYARKELDYTQSTHLKRWMGKDLNWTKISEWDYPWEIEAYGREIGLVSRFLEFNAKKLNLSLLQYGKPTTK